MLRALVFYGRRLLGRGSRRAGQMPRRSYLVCLAASSSLAIVVAVTVLESAGIRIGGRVSVGFLNATADESRSRSEVGDADDPGGIGFGSGFDARSLVGAFSGTTVNPAGLIFSDWLSLQETRRDLMRRTCAGVGVDRRDSSELIDPRGGKKSASQFGDCTTRLDGILIDKSNHILYCAVPKVASSSVKLAMVLMTGAVNRTASNAMNYPVHSNRWLRDVGVYSIDYLMDREPNWLKKSWSKLRKFLVVRQPFERVVSAYVDKFTLQNKFTDYFQRRFGRKIVRLYRNRFVESANRKHSKRRTADESGHDVTFGEFVRFLVDDDVSCSRKSNPHWMSYADLCRPCFIDYDYVVHYERLGDEMRHLWTVLYNETNVEQVLLRRNAGKVKSGELVSSFVDALPKEHVQALHDLYSIDFRMFGYAEV